MARAASLVCIAALGCAAQAPAPDAEWRNSPPTAPLEVATIGVDPEAVATRVRDDIECRRAVADLDRTRGAEGLAWRTILACHARGKWRDLRRALDAPELRELSAKDAAILAAEIVARRGGITPSDLVMCQRAGIPIYETSEAFGASARPRGTLLLLRATLVSDGPDRSGARTVELAEQARVPKVQTFRWRRAHHPPIFASPRGKDAELVASGVTVWFRAPPGHPVRPTQEPYVYLVRLVASEDMEKRAAVELIGHWAAGPLGPD